MKVMKITPQGYCHGVVHAINIVTESAFNNELPRPIYILGQIVHNRHITNALAELGIETLEATNATRLELLEKIDHGTVIMTAHGVSPQVIQTATDKGLHVIDATCSDVTTTHKLLAEKINEGYEFFYIGKKGHPEPEGATGIHPQKIHLVETADDIANINVTSDKLLITNQTTLSIWDVAKVAKAIQAAYPQAEFIKEICNATQVRQEAVAAQAQFTDLILVVGDPKSNNTNRLAQIAEESGTPAKRIADVSEVDLDWFTEDMIIGVTSGASTPTQVMMTVFRYLEQLDLNDENTWSVEGTLPKEKLLPIRKYKDAQAKKDSQ
ncbi:4-hydroxy-3-methylbut-2-enyl diphosphate reductase [Culicoidibacter larvae]|uniref:4-hydroxy-3-methylbut-2-enyl diphosphate reductase n=1 Tax=Culicoidibacter larvae TaxID=2579976 RepID=A0A5R8QFI9_9FIRM|nr:4-hydroxy-3-methylbut-2-enyl diphosphate reductase [Culicoidibacter larvae]TLG76775.1 4-hydroxy-3-methylbut-2-enyl diphosphate reductase [Culicoidibacter larvae]